MGRAEERKLDRYNRIESRKNKLLLTKQQISDMKKESSMAAIKYDVEALMTCFALAEHRLYGFGAKRIFRSLAMIDSLMDGIMDDSSTMEDYKKELEDEAGVIIKCD